MRGKVITVWQLISVLTILALIFLVFSANIVTAEATPSLLLEGNRYVEASLVSDVTVVPSLSNYSVQTPRVGVLFKIKKGWHIYWKNSGDSGSPTKIQLFANQGISVSDIQWPAPIRIKESNSITVFGYKDTTLLVADLLLPSTKIQSGKVTLQADVNFLVCKRVCLPGHYQLELSLPIADHFEQISSDLPLFEKFSSQFPLKDQALSQVSEQSPGISSLAQPVSNSLSAAPGADALLSFPLPIKTTPTNQVIDLQNKFQVFPYANNKVKFVEPFIALDYNRNAVVILPVHFANHISDLQITLAGNILIAPDTIGNTKELNINWQHSQKIESAIVPNPSFPTISLNEKSILKYRLLEVSKPIYSSKQLTGLFSLGDLLFAISLGFLAGIILNFMPCVLPVLSIKVLSIVSGFEKSKSERLFSAIAYTLGILVSFAGLATLLVGLKGLGEEIGWGMQFQHIGFVFSLVIIVFILSLAFFEFYQINVPGLQSTNTLSSRASGVFVKNFLEGILATLLSTPCSAPLLGTALAFAFIGSTLTIYVVFFFIGLGLALPYVLISMSNSIARLLPKPGKWMATLRQLMGLLLLGTVAWLLFVIDGLSENGVMWTLMLLFVLFILLWLIKTLSIRSQIGKILFLCVALFATSHTWNYVSIPRVSPKTINTSGIKWQSYSEALVREAVEQNRPTFVRFTADWCVTCKYNEQIIFQSKEIVDAFQTYNIVPLVADWTQEDEAIGKALMSYGGNAVPYYVAISANGEKTLYPGPLLTKASLLHALRKIK